MRITRTIAIGSMLLAAMIGVSLAQGPPPGGGEKKDHPGRALL